MSTETHGSGSPGGNEGSAVPPAEGKPTAGAPGAPLNPLQALDLERLSIEALRTCFDPEIPVNVYELGLIYEVKVEPTGHVAVKMTLTSPACPVAGTLPLEVESKIKEIPGVAGARVEIVWDPPWHPGLMSEAARLELNMM